MSHRALSRGGFQVHDYFIKSYTISWWLNKIILFPFLFVCNMISYLGHSCLSLLQENTGYHPHIPTCLHPVTWREMPGEKPLTHFKFSPSSYKWYTQCNRSMRISSARILLLCGIWEFGSTAWGRHFRRGFHRNLNFPSSCSCSLSLYF